MNVISIVENDPVNSITGFSTTVYFAGCEHHCKGCFSPQTWEYNQGERYTVDELLDILKLSKNKNISLIGGDIFYPLNRIEGIELIKKIKYETNKNIYIWTGYSKEQVEKWIDVSMIDFLIDGKFELNKRDIRLNLRGSSNQRIFFRGTEIFDEDLENIIKLIRRDK